MAHLVRSEVLERFSGMPPDEAFAKGAQDSVDGKMDRMVSLYSPNYSMGWHAMQAMLSQRRLRKLIAARKVVLPEEKE